METNSVLRVNGILETAIYVADLDVAANWYHDVFGFEAMLRDERICALAAGAASVLLLFRKGSTTGRVQMPGGFIPSHDGDGRIHFAFAIDTESYDSWRGRLREKGVAIESEVNAVRGGRSLYIRDPDGHLLELATPGLWPMY